MGSYLAIGIVTRIEARARDSGSEKLMASDIREALGNEYNLSLFKQENLDGGGLVWRIDPGVVMRQLPEFLERQYALFPARGTARPGTREILESLWTCRSGEGMLDYAGSSMDERCRIISDNDWGRAEKCGGRFGYRYDMLSYCLYGKAMMETYSELFGYLGRVIRRSSPDLSIAGAVKLAIVG